MVLDFSRLLPRLHSEKGLIARHHRFSLDNTSYSYYSSNPVPWWWNGRHDGFKIRCSQGRGGSSPPRGTIQNSIYKNSLDIH